MRTLQSSTLVSLLLLASLSVMLTPAFAADTTVNSDATWTGAVVLTGNVTVANGTTLTISPGTTVDGTDDHWIRIDGTLIADDTTFFSSETPLTQGSHGAGLWVGIHISSTGHAQFNNVTINNAKTGVRNDGTVHATDLTINDAYIGMNNQGTATLNALSANNIDYDVVRTTGDFSLAGATIANVAGGILSSGTSDVSDASFTQTGSALKATSGQFTATRIGFDAVTVGIASQAGATMHVSSVIGTSVALAVDAGDSDALTLDNMVLSGHRLLLGNGAMMLTANDITFTGNLNETRAIIDQRCSGTCTWNDTSLSNTVWGASLSGSGVHQLNNMTIDSTERNIDAAGTGELVMGNLGLTGSDAAISLRGLNSEIDTALSLIHI